MKTIVLNKETYVLKSDADMAVVEARKKKGGKVEVGSIPFIIGEKYFFRTVTYFATGQVVAVHGQFLELADAAWIADTGRFRDAIMTGALSEVEPVEVPMFLNIASITDAFVWTHSLPRTQL